MAPVLYLITSRRMWGVDWERALLDQVRAAASAGVDLVQVREADLDGRLLKNLVRACMTEVRGTRTRVLVNERIDVALAAGAHGVHLRSSGVPTARARSLCPAPMLIGRSVHDGDDVKTAGDGADYLVFGTVFPSQSKPGSVSVGLGALERTVRATALPVLAVGGLTPGRTPEVLAAGAAGIAAIGAFRDPSRSVPQFLGAGAD